MDAVDNSMFHIPTSSLTSDVATEYVSAPTQATVAPAKTNTINDAAVSPATIDVSPKNPQPITINNSVNAQSSDYLSIYLELSAASEEIIQCRNNRLNNVY